MKLSRMALASLTLSSLAACGDPDKVVEFIPTPPERLVCEEAGPRPAIPPEHEIDWSQVRSLDQAQAEHARYVASIRSREGVIVGYLVSLEGNLFTCSDNMAWRRQFEAGME